MDHFQYIDGQLNAEAVSLGVIAKEVGTPFYCYSTAALENHYEIFSKALKNLNAKICYSVKANSNVAVIATLARLGAGADVVSGGELKRALAAGITGDDIIFSGVGKTNSELKMALTEGVSQINVESEPELNTLSAIASSLGVVANVGIRVNPDIDAKTHEKIKTGTSEDKFGIDIAIAQDVFRRASSLPSLNLRGIAVHIGSQLTSLYPYQKAYKRIMEFSSELLVDGIQITDFDLGGGLGINYNDDQIPSPEDYGKMVEDIFENSGYKLTFEPGRMIAGNAGVLVSRVIFVKKGIEKTFCIIDSAMNDLIRPTLYGAYHKILKVKQANASANNVLMDVVGPICESGDYFAKNRLLPAVKTGDLMAVCSVGAYGAVMGSTYNSRPMIPEIIVNGDNFATVRERISVDEMMNFEHLPNWIV